MATGVLPAFPQIRTAFTRSQAKGTLVPSWAHEMVVTPALEGAFYDVIGNW
jgi:glucose/mannose transport system substrate-binding protein